MRKNAILLKMYEKTYIDKNVEGSHIGAEPSEISPIPRGGVIYYFEWSDFFNDQRKRSKVRPEHQKELLQDPFDP